LRRKMIGIGGIKMIFNNDPDDFDLIFSILLLMLFGIALTVFAISYLAGEIYLPYYPTELLENGRIVVESRNFYWNNQEHICAVSNILYSNAQNGGRFSAKPSNVCETLRLK
jgi:hypothetical protein